MIRNVSGINVFIDEELDFCIIVDSYSDMTEAEEIVSTCCSRWFTDGDVTESDITLADYIAQCLKEKDIGFEIYFSDYK